MTKLLDASRAGELGALIVEDVIDTGYEPEELIPALVQAIINIASHTRYREQLLDEAANFLAEGGI